MNYDLEYYENMLRNYSATAEKISKIRWEFIKSLDPVTVLDYGSGVGWFRAFRPRDIRCLSCDVADYPQTKTSRRENYDVVCFWDVLEHIPDFAVIESVLLSTKYAALTIPIKPKKVEFHDWKHFKPGEHLHYFTPELLVDLFDKYNFSLSATGTPECPPRQDIHSFIFKNNKNGKEEISSPKSSLTR